MTEYKKLVALTEELSKDVDLLVSEHQARSIGDATEAMDSSTIDSLFVTACRIREAVSGGAPRILKILTKARETDPNRQIYNENMCAKIEDLFVAFTDNIYKLLYGGESHIDNEEAVDEGREEIISCILEGREVPLELSAALASIENAHDLALLERAANEAWASRIAGDMTQHVLFEQQGRQVLLAEEKQARLFLVEEKRKDKKALMDVGRLFQELKWCAESHRRATERLWLCEAVHAVPVESVAALLRARLPGEELRRTVSRNIGALCSALLTRPEDPNIRRLRCNNSTSSRTTATAVSRLVRGTRVVA